MRRRQALHDVRACPTTLPRTNKLTVSFVYAFVEERKPIAAICRGPVMLIATNALRGRMITSWPSLQTDVRNAGGRWTDEQVVVNRNLVTSRTPEDIPAFIRLRICPRSIAQ